MVFVVMNNVELVALILLFGEIMDGERATFTLTVLQNWVN